MGENPSPLGEDFSLNTENMKNIRLTQIDGKLPNLALMKLAHWHKKQDHKVFFERSVTRSIFEPNYDIVYGSAIFSTSAKKLDIFRSHFPDAIIGGTGTKNSKTVESVISVEKYEHFDYSIYPYFQNSIGFTQRGCRLKCKFCVVPEKEGNVQEINTLHDIWRGEPYPKNILLLDNDFFGQPSWKARCEEAIIHDFKVSFSQGINIRLVHREGAEMLAKMKFRDDQFREKRIYTAWDNRKEEKRFLTGINLLLEAGIKPDQIMVYFLCNYWEKGLTGDVWHRLESMQKIGLRPYPMIYDVQNASRELKEFQTWVIRRAYMKQSLSEYMKRKKKQCNTIEKPLIQLMI